jgi:hypothetical protein
MSDYFKSFKVAKPEFQLLKEGEHVVRLLRVEVLNSFQQFNGATKDELPPWKNATPQLAITVVAAEEGKSGGMTHRINGCGYRKYDDLSAKEIKSGKYEDINGYACYKDEDDDVVREEDEERTQSCANIINQIANAMKIKEGTPLLAGLEEAIADQTNFKVTVVNEPYDGKDQFRLTKFRAIATVAADAI